MDVNVLRGLLDKGQLEPYIRHIRFPQYKNISPLTQIDFTFPITALVGANGTNKSSLLRALYGAPGENNLGNYWFSTQTDPIDVGKDFPSSFVYGYMNTHTKSIVEVVKQRVHKKSDPDYWEPSRPIVRYGMQIPQRPADASDPFRLQTRWRPINKNVELIDFRHMLSAFDRYFYYGDFSKEETFKSKKAFLRARSKKLKAAIDKGSEHVEFYGKNRIVGQENRTLSPNEIKIISNIIGRNYVEIKLIRHIFYRLDGYTALIRGTEHQYSEAFAGSGEFAIIMIVTRIMAAQENSLLLLDEPEVSLHPGAQERLLDFLFEQVKKHKHQVIFTTHSPALIRHLPPDAIKVFSQDATNQEVLLTSQSSLVEEAFLQIGEPLPGVYIILVEDRLAKELVQKALRIHHPDLLTIVKVNFFSGGASVLTKHYLPPYAAENRSDVLCLFDGDQRPKESWPKCDKIRTASHDVLAALIVTMCGAGINFPIDGTRDEEEKKRQTEDAQRNFLRWYAAYVDYLPGDGNPEAFVLSKNGINYVGNPKQKFVEMTRESLGLVPTEADPSSIEIFEEQRRAVKKIDNGDKDLRSIASKIHEFCRTKQKTTKR